MTTGTVWPQLMSTALVGTRRRPAAITADDSPLGTLVAGGVLGAAAALTVARRAGSVAATGVTPPVPAIDDPRPSVGDTAAARLSRLVDDGTESGLLGEWLRLAAERDYRVPGRFLPALFDLAHRDAVLRPLVVTVGGVRGEWLAAQRPVWQWAKDAVADVEDEATWHEGTPGERTAYLTALRRRDRRAALDLLTSVWPEERPEERAAFLAVLADGLDPADETFCEAALDDRRKEVRTIAADLLAVLPGAAYGARMASRAAACVTIGRRLVVTPPVEYDATMARDGIERKPPRGTGERAWWLEQIVARTPPGHWTLSPGELLGRKVGDDWAPTLHRAWARAAVTNRDTGWATALVEAGFGRGRGAAVNDTVLSTSLYELLPAVTALSLATRVLKEGVARENTAHLVHLLEACPRPWPRSLADTVLRYLGEWAAVPASWRPRGVCHVAAAAMPVECADDARALADRVRSDHPDSGHIHVLDQLADTLSNRFQMHRELS